MSRFEGKLVVVTGAAQGIGEAIATKFLENGATVILAGRTLSKVEATAAKFNSDKAVPFKLDVSKPEDWQALVAFIQKNYDGLDALVNNAGLTNAISQGMKDATDEDFDRIMKTDLYGVFYGIKYCYQVLKKGVYSSIVSIGSFAGLTLNKGTGGDVAYQTAKYAIRHMSKHAALNLAPDCIRVNVVHPGGVMTQITKTYLEGIGADANEILSAVNPLPPHYADPEDIAEAVLFLSDPKTARAITGAEVSVDSGASLQ